MNIPSKIRCMVMRVLDSSHISGNLLRIANRFAAEAESLSTISKDPTSEEKIDMDKPKTEKYNESKTVAHLRYGLSSMQGWRISMDDVLGISDQ